MRNDKRQMEDSYASDNSNNDMETTKRIKNDDSEDELITKYTCSRMM